jgi:hypothetical protein
MASQRPARATYNSTTPIREESNPYLPLATSEDVTSNELRPMNEVPKALDYQPRKSFLERIEHNQVATRVFWFFVGLWSGGIVSCVVIVPILRA